MTYKRFFIILSILIVFGVAVFLFLGDSRTALVKRDLSFSQDRSEKDLLHLHPLASDNAIKAARKQTVETWEEWIDARTEAWLGVQVKHGFLKTPEEIAAERLKIRENVVKLAEMFKPLLDKPPTVGGKPPWHLIPGATSPVIVRPKKYEGPRTVEGLMEAFDAKYVEMYPGTSSYDAYYTRTEWLQMLLDKGTHFENRDDYNALLNIRGWVINAESRPDWWSEGKGGVSPTDNFATYKNAYIDRQIWQQEVYNSVTQEDPTASSVRFFDDRPDKYLVMYNDTIYINRNVRTIKAWGTGTGARLTKEQKRALYDKGTHPEGVNVVYIDRDYNTLSEEPPIISWEDYLRSHMTDAQREEEALELDAFGKMLEIYEEDTVFSEEQFLDDDPARSTVREAAAAAQEAAKAEFEKFENSIRQLEEFATMSDTEIEKQLEKQFRQQFLPKNPLEQLEQFTPERLEKALGTLFQHGFEEGFRRVRRDSPALAEQLERFFGQEQKPPPEMQKKPQRPAPPKSPEAAPSEPEAP